MATTTYTDGPFLDEMCGDCDEHLLVLSDDGPRCSDDACANGERFEDDPWYSMSEEYDMEYEDEACGL